MLDNERRNQIFICVQQSKKLNYVKTFKQLIFFLLFIYLLKCLKRYNKDKKYY